MKTENTFTALIYVGAKEGYDGVTHNYAEAKKICQKYWDEISYCITITKTNFIYKKGNELGFIIGLINYPRFPESSDMILDKAITIAKLFGKEFNQGKISIVCSDKTYMLEQNIDY